jgi:Holliday junction resolvase-like predicted endonuclease
VKNLSIERNLLISILKMTQKGPASLKTLNLDARIPSGPCNILLSKLQSEDYIYLNGDEIGANARMRLRLASKAVTLGADIESLSRFLGWQEFEEITAEVLEQNGYATKRTVRFKQRGRRWEIDVVGCRKPLVLCIDCKHWSRGVHLSSLQRMAQDQAERVAAFAEFLPSTKLNLPCSSWEKAKFIPVILSLTSNSGRFCGDIPIVPVLMLQEFISQLPLNLEMVCHVNKEFIHL